MKTDKMNRREMLQMAGATGTTLAFTAGRPSLASALSGSVVWVAYGGATQEAQRQAMAIPFTQDTGVEVIVASGPDLAKLKAQVQTGNVEWDLMAIIGSQAVQAGEAGLLEEIDYDVIDASGLAIEPLKYCVPYYAYDGGIAFDPKRHPEGKHPTNWQEFWDVENFPGRRGLRNRADENLEMALLADGVPAKDLYPLDVDRAFASLDRIKPHVTHWISETPQTISLLTQGEIDFVFTYSGRVHAAQADGQSVGYVYKNNIVTGAYKGIPKGAPNREAAMQLISYFLDPKRQADFCNRMGGYTPSKIEGLNYLDPEVRAKQPDLSDPGTAVTNVEWWAEHGEEVSTRFKTWLLM